MGRPTWSTLAYALVYPFSAIHSVTAGSMEYSGIAHMDTCKTATTQKIIWLLHPNCTCIPVHRRQLANGARTSNACTHARGRLQPRAHPDLLEDILHSWDGARLEKLVTKAHVDIVDPHDTDSEVENVRQHHVSQPRLHETGQISCPLVGEHPHNETVLPCILLLDQTQVLLLWKNIDLEKALWQTYLPAKSKQAQ
jgi:hypothetical protein